MSGKVSLIIPAYNADKYLADAIESVLAQSYGEVECIVVDDGSTDRTAEIANGFGQQIRYAHQSNAGRSAARNTGLAMATGEFISFLDADDILAREKLTEQVAFLEARGDCDVVYSRAQYFREENGVRRYFSVKRATPEGDILPELVYGNFITILAPLIRRKAIDRAGGFDPSLSRYEDWEFLLRLAISGAGFGYMDRCHAFCRMHAENTVQDRRKMFEAKLHAAEMFVEKKRPELVRRGIDVAAVMAFHRADYGRILILDGCPDEGRSLIAAACQQVMPHRQKFRFYAFLAGVVPVAILVKLQQLTDMLCKYRTEPNGEDKR
jgi:glycosyltransferase involved in cell wall biosynthesis